MFRFAKICFMFESRSKKYFHAQWYQHGAHTILQESAHPHSLFLIQECEDQPLECIFQKCHLQTLGNVEDETVHRGTRDEDLFSGFDLAFCLVLFLTICSQGAV